MNYTNYPSPPQANQTPPQYPNSGANDFNNVNYPAPRIEPVNTKY